MKRFWCRTTLVLMLIIVANSASRQKLNAQESDIQKVEIRNSKLSPINMGLDSLDHWIEKMSPGDARRGESLIKDLEKLRLFQRSEKIQPGPANDAGEQVDAVLSL